MTQKEIAMLLLGGEFEKAVKYLAENVEWNLYEDKQTISGRKNVLDFCKKVGEYFRSVTTRSEMFGIIERRTRCQFMAGQN